MFAVMDTPPILPPTVFEIAPIVTIILSQIIVIPSALLAMSMYNVPLFGIKLPQVTTPEAMGARFQRLYRWSLAKLYWDEAYHKAFVAPFVAAAALALGYYWTMLRKNPLPAAAQEKVADPGYDSSKLPPTEKEQQP